MAKHKQPEIQSAIEYLKANRWTVDEESSGHLWCTVSCPYGCCTKGVAMSHLRPDDMAGKLRRAHDDHP
jgi:hypothetical protein